MQSQSKCFDHILPDVIFNCVETLGTRCTGRFLTLHAMENRVYEVEREDGSKVVIKFYRPGRWSQDTVQAEHDFMVKAAEADIPVVAPLPDESGNTLFSHEKIFYAVYPKRPGRLEPELSKDRLRRLGHYLARLHNVGSSFKNAARRTLSPEMFGLEATEQLKQLKIVPPEFMTRFESQVRDICGILTPIFAKSSMILVHGDCHVGNVLWNDDEPFLLDFDDAIYAPPVQDMWLLTGGGDQDSLVRRSELLHAYCELRTFDYDTLRLIEPLRTLRIIHFSSWIGSHWEEDSFKKMFPQFPSHGYWHEQIETLSEQTELIQKFF